MNARSTVRARGISRLSDRPIAALACALIAGLVSAALLLLLFSAFSLSRTDPAAALRPLSLCALFLSALVCGIVAGRTSPTPLPAALIAGGLYALLLALLSLLPIGDADSALSLPLQIALRLGTLAMSLFGAWITRKRKNNRHTYKKRRR